MRLSLIAAICCLAATAMAQSEPATVPATTATSDAIFEKWSAILDESATQAVTAPATSTSATSITAPASTTSAPATSTAPAVDEAAMKLLVQLEQAGEKYNTLQAAIDYRVENAVLGTDEFHTGSVAYQRRTDKMPAKFRIQFDTAKYGSSAASAEKVEYAYDGLWLTISKGKIKNMTRRQYNAPGEKDDPFKLGKGPFPLPFGQPADEVVSMFAARTRDARSSDPKNTAFLELTPLPGQEKDYDFIRLQMWVDQDTLLPAKIISSDRNRDIKTVIFKDVKAGAELDQKLFKPDKPAGWELIIEPMK